jgi:CsoR family transcriptional regulator, copper-sensing transcriptional repressor
MGVLMAEEKTEEKAKIVNRLKRVEGQLRGLQRMIEADAACEEILTQMAAATGAMKKTGVEIIHAYMTRCLDIASRDGNKSLHEFEKALSRYISMS